MANYACNIMLFQILDTKANHIVSLSLLVEQDTSFSIQQDKEFSHYCPAKSSNQLNNVILSYYICHPNKFSVVMHNIHNRIRIILDFFARQL